MSKDEKKFFKDEFEKKLTGNLDKEILNKLNKGEALRDDELRSTDYEKFRKENMPKSFTFYEKLCYYSEILLKIAPDKKTSEKLEEVLYDAHLNASPTGVQSAAVLVPGIFLLLGAILILLTPIIGFGIILIALVSYFILIKVPYILRNIFRGKANDQIIVAVFYLVSFMRFNPNMELATGFAATHIGPPMSLDFKRILWDLENQKYPNIKVAFDEYLQKWKDTNLEFLEAIYLVETSLNESEETRRISMLDKALDTLLQGNYEKILHFSQQLKSKVNTFNMLGVVLPILGLIILPLAASFGDPKGVWQFTLILYSILIPFGVGTYSTILTTGKPGGVNSIKPIKSKDMSKYTNIPIKISKNKYFYLNPLYYAIIVFLIFFLIGMSPLIIHYSMPQVEENLNQGEFFLTELSSGKVILFKKIKDTYMFGPYGFYPGVLSLFITLSLGLSIGYYFFYKYKNLIHMRDKTKRLENQFTTATFQLGNRISEGISSELAFGIVADTMKGTEAATFFNNIDRNIKFNGMSIEKAIFDEEKGAILDYPSEVVNSSMKIMVRSLEQGPEIASKTLVDLSKYLTELHMAHERLIDLLAESLSSMKSQKSFLAPVISGIVIAIVSLVTSIMGTLKEKVSGISAGGNTGGLAGGGASPGSILGDSIPTFLFQVPVGIYIIALTAILVNVINDLEAGEDPILKKYSIGQSLVSSMKKYMIITIIGMLIFAIVGKEFIGGALG